MSARPGLRGGYRASDIPTAISLTGFGNRRAQMQL